MKIRLFAALLIALLSLSLLTGCDLGNPEAQTKINDKINLAAAQLPAKTAENPEALPVVGENPEVTAPLEPTQSPAPQPTQPERLTAEQIKAIALEHAGLKADQVTRLRAEFDYDDGVPEYEVEFYHDGTEYEYEIHAETGKILRSHKEKEYTPQPPETQPPETQPSTQERLTAEQVKEIALKHAGLKADQVSRLHVEFEYDDGRPEYQVEFRYNGWEYDYEIHAQTGKILDWDKEFDD